MVLPTVSTNPVYFQGFPPTLPVVGGKQDGKTSSTRISVISVCFIVLHKLIFSFFVLTAFCQGFSCNKQTFISHCSWPGKAHDTRVFNNSPVREELADLCYVPDQRLDKTYHILGDSAYPLSNHLMTPFRVRLTMSLAEKKFNTNLASKRSVIERAFGLLGQHFPRLLKWKVKSSEKKIMCIVSTCVLHNWCILENNVDEDDFEEAISNFDFNVNRFSAEAELGHRRALGGGNTKREMLCDYINSKV